MINPMELLNRTVLVTGASSGIGRETAVLLSQLGAKIILVGRNPEQIDRTYSELDGSGHISEIFDLASALDEIPRWMKNITSKTGPLNGLVHSAGIQITKPLRIMNNSDIDEVMKINVMASFALVKGFRQKDVCNAESSIVFISSVMGLVGQPGIAAYSASKGALIALAKSLALELAREGIRVNCVAPAHVQTEMAEKLKETLTSEQFDNIKRLHPLGIGKPRDVAQAIAFLLADTGRWITGTTLIVDGGYTAQ